MANADQILTLIKSHIEGDEERFRTTALQISALEAKAGHTVLARSINELIKSKQKLILKPTFRPIQSDLQEFVLEIENPYRFTDLVCNENVSFKIKRVINEHVQREKLYQFNLENRRKLLLAGPSGTGKTMTASIIANELDKPLYIVLMEKVVTKFMGETSLKLRKIFDFIQEIPGVYLFDEFDAIGSQRGMDNEVGEMRRILNSFLQFMERDHSESLILAATNNLDVLDKALFRRFDDVIEYSLPADEEIIEILQQKLNNFSSNLNFYSLLPALRSMSHAEITIICTDAIKEALLNNKVIDINLIDSIVSQRYSAYKKVD
nr:ATP-binding protein [uncultured Bacteroides sp.]